LFPGQLLRYRRPVLWQELVLVGIGYYLYREARNLVPNQPSIAYRHGNSVQWLQEHLHLDFELSVNRFVSGIPWLAQVMNYYYATLHFLVTVGVLTWLFVSRKRVYLGLRTFAWWWWPSSDSRLSAGSAIAAGYDHIDTGDISPGPLAGQTSPSTPTSSPRCRACTSMGVVRRSR
jgi:hypothetical protein